MPVETLQGLEIGKLLSGDGPSLRALGIFATASLERSGAAVLMVDALGLVHVMPPALVDNLRRPRVAEEDLDPLEDDRVIEVMVAQGDEDEVIFSYLERRKERERQEGP